MDFHEKHENVLPRNVLDEIIRFSKTYGINRVTLFGSRARGTNRERSDVDIFVSGKDVDGFRAALEDEAETLLRFDVIDAGGKVSDELKAEIERDGVVIYEEI